MASLNGKSIVFTGTLTMKRADAKKQAEAAGAKVLAAVSGNTDIVVAGPGAGSKLDSAKAKGTQIWTEEEFVAAIGGGGKKAAAGAAKKAAPKKRGKAAKEEDEEKEEEEEAPAAKKAKKPAAPKKAAPTGKGKKAKKEEEEEEAEEEEEEAAAPPPPAKKKAAAVKKEAPTPAPASPKKEGGAPRAARPDRSVPGAAAYSIHQEYTVKLNQTNVGGNNNKFYIINLLTKESHYWVWTRWGRVGEEGQNMLIPFGSDEGAAKKGFEKKFREKTQNSWDDRSGFVKKAGKYQLVETEETDGDGGDGSVPLGKLTKAQIEKGQGVLKKIEDAINKGGNNSNKLNDLSSEFFSLIPTDFGRRRPEPLRTMDAVHEKEELLKFYLRMGFEEMEEEKGLTPIHGVMALPLPKTLAAAASMLCDKYSIQSSEERGRELAKQQAGAPAKKMGEELYASIMLYTSNAIYANLNKVLREENRAGVKKFFSYLRLFMEAMEHLTPQKRTLWRGVSVDLSAQYKVGSTITWWGVSSCTSDEQVARNFMRGCGGKCTLLTVECKTARDISCVTFYSNEKESLLAPGTQLKVKSNKTSGNITEITLEEIGRLIS